MEIKHEQQMQSRKVESYMRIKGKGNTEPPKDQVNEQVETILKDRVARRILYFLSPKQANKGLMVLKKRLAVAIFYIGMTVEERNMDKKELELYCKLNFDKMYFISQLFNVQPITYGEVLTFIERMKLPIDKNPENEDKYFEASEQFFKTILIRLSEAQYYINIGETYNVHPSVILKTYFEC